ncbi:hypothetical protein AB1K54_00440 [Microbacterium sp. BWT-B31]|uniref:hypothetical protein n=1 Tax=Microbacterium sp. BWT-B31 TaxID=3232072 RepID=UPI003528889C
MSRLVLPHDEERSTSQTRTDPVKDELDLDLPEEDDLRDEADMFEEAARRDWASRYGRS